MIDVNHHLTAPFTIVLLPLTLAWLLSIGLSAASARLERSRFTLARGDDRWADVTSAAQQFHDRSRRPRTGRVMCTAGGVLILWFSVLIAQRLTWYQAIAMGVTLLWLARRGNHYLAFVVLLGFGAAVALSSHSGLLEAFFYLSVSLWIYVVGRRWSMRKYPSYRTATDRPTIDDWLVPRHHFVWSQRRSMAALASFVVLSLFAAVIYTYGASKWVLLTDPPSSAAALRTARGLPGGRIEQWSILVAALARVQVGVAEIVLISTMGLLYRLNSLVLRLWAPDLTEIDTSESTDGIVYLRNFADDRVTLRAGTYSRTPLLQVIFDVLVPVRRRPFEQVLAGLLWRFGPVIAAADPNRSLRTSGALTASLSHETWRDEVIGWCRTAPVIVVSATPTQINDGLREELRLLSDTIGHERVVLVVGPGTVEQVRTRFALFRSAFPPESPLLDGLDAPYVVDGTLVLVRNPDGGWDAWGARYRTESAYAVALDEAIAHGRAIWPTTGGASRGAAPIAASSTAASPRPMSAPTSAPPVRVVDVEDHGTPPGVEIIPGRMKARVRETLTMRCDHEDSPNPLGPEIVVGRWWAEVAVTGLPRWQSTIKQGVVTSIYCCVTEHRLYAIVTSVEVEEQVWISVSRSRLSATGTGARGTIRRRPEMIEVSGPGWTASLRDVSRTFSHAGIQDGQEKSLLRALTAPMPSTPELAAPAAAVEPHESPSGDWTPVGHLGIYVESRNGTRTGATSLSDPRQHQDQQVAHIRSLDWVPANYREDACRRLTAASAPGPARSTHGLRGGDQLLDSPIGFPWLAVVRPTPAGAPALRTYLWPAVGRDLAPQLEPGESVLFEWNCESPLRYEVRGDLSSPHKGRRLVPESVAHNACWTLTTGRLLLSTRGRSRVDVGVMHIRLQWVTLVIVESYTYPGGRKPATLGAALVFDTGHGVRAKIDLRPGDPTGPARAAVLTALRDALEGLGISDIGDRTDRQDHGHKGTLIRRHLTIGSGAFGVPADLIVR